jgi:hypothetical protein
MCEWHNELSKRTAANAKTAQPPTSRQVTEELEQGDIVDVALQYEIASGVLP